MILCDIISELECCRKDTGECCRRIVLWEL